jgi:hypothetical protein
MRPYDKTRYLARATKYLVFKRSPERSIKAKSMAWYDTVYRPG